MTSNVHEKVSGVPRTQNESMFNQTISLTIIMIWSCM